MVLSVLAAGITGILYLIPILFVLPEIEILLTVANGQPIGLLFKTVTGSTAGGFGLLFLSKCFPYPSHFLPLYKLIANYNHPQ